MCDGALVWSDDIVGLAKELEGEIEADCIEASTCEFYTALASGTLDERRWVRYLEDDARMLRDWSVYFARLGARAGSTPLAGPLNGLSAGLNFGARDRIGGLLAKRGRSIDDVLAAPHFPWSEVYTRAVSTYVNEPQLALGVAVMVAILVHHRFTGRHFADHYRGLPDTEHGAFVRHFGSAPQFLAALDGLEAGLDALASTLTKSELQAVRRAYRIASRMDRLFADPHSNAPPAQRAYPEAFDEA